MNKPFNWNAEKSQQLQERHGFGFADVSEAIETNGVIDDIMNPSQNHQGQGMLIVMVKGYPVCVPYVENENEIFFKTAFPNRKFKPKS